LDFLFLKKLKDYTSSLYKNKSIKIKKRYSIGPIIISSKKKYIYYEQDQSEAMNQKQIEDQDQSEAMNQDQIEDQDQSEAMKRFKAKFDKKREKTQNIFFAYRQ